MIGFNAGEMFDGLFLRFLEIVNERAGSLQPGFHFLTAETFQREGMEQFEQLFPGSAVGKYTLIQEGLRALGKKPCQFLQDHVGFGGFGHQDLTGINAQGLFQGGLVIFRFGQTKGSGGNVQKSQPHLLLMHGKG